MELESFEKIMKIFDKGGISFSSKKEIVAIFKNENWKSLIDDFQKMLDRDEIPKKKKPHFAFIFFLALMIVNEEDIEEIARYIKKKKVVRNYMFIGTKIFISSQYPNFKININLSSKNFNNKYEYIERFRGGFGYYKISPLILLLKTIYYCSEEKFYELLKEDTTNIVFLNIIDGSTMIRLDENSLVDFLNSKDELKSNGALFYLMGKINSCRRYEKEEELEVEILRIEKVFDKIEKEQQIHLIINYISTNENIIPTFFMDRLKGAAGLIAENLEKLNLTDFSKLINIYVLIKEINNSAIQQLFKKYLIGFIKKDYNIAIWGSNKDLFKEIIRSFDTKILDDIKLELDIIERELYITDFDKQIRIEKYSVDIQKSYVIQDIKNSLI